MEINPLTASCVELPGRAGELMRQNATAALLRELGDNYARYHAALRAQLDAIGGPPDPARYRGDGDGTDDDSGAYGRHVDSVQRIVATEQLLRRARALRREGTELQAPSRGEPPLWDSNHRLVDVEHPERSTFRQGLSAPFGTQPLADTGGAPQVG